MLRLVTYHRGQEAPLKVLQQDSVHVKEAAERADSVLAQHAHSFAEPVYGEEDYLFYLEDQDAKKE